MAINDIGNSIPQPAKYGLIADDLNVSLLTGDLTFAQFLHQQTLNNLNMWSNTIGLQYSPIKSICMVFNRKESNISPFL